MANYTKKLFGEKIIELSNAIFGKNPEYFDDFYYFRNRIFEDISQKFARVNPISMVMNTMKELNFDINKITYDIEDRKNKYPSPICFLSRFHQIYVFSINKRVHILTFKAAFMNLVMLCMPQQLDLI